MLALQCYAAGHLYKLVISYQNFSTCICICPTTHFTVCLILCPFYVVFHTVKLFIPWHARRKVSLTVPSCQPPPLEFYITSRLCMTAECINGATYSYCLKYKQPAHSTAPQRPLLQYVCDTVNCLAKTLMSLPMEMAQKSSSPFRAHVDGSHSLCSAFIPNIGLPSLVKTV
jgi:hypothetical protein